MNVAIGHSVSSEDISAGGHLDLEDHLPTRMGRKRITMSTYLSSSDTRANPKESKLSSRPLSWTEMVLHHRHVFAPKGSRKSTWGWGHFVKRSVLQSFFVTNGSFIIVAEVKVLHGDSLDVPPSNIGSHLGLLRDSTDGSDVSFSVNGRVFPAHRAPAGCACRSLAGL